jgi:HK97 family phage portal protein
MRIFDLFKPKQKALSNYGSWQELFLNRSSSGVVVTNKTALNISTVFACIRNISEDVAKVPLKVYKKKGDEKERLTDHPLHRIVNYSPNPDMTAMDFRQTLTAHCLGWGNGYAEIVRTVLDEVDSLYPLPPDKVTPKRHDNGDIYYEVQRDDGTVDRVRSENMLHIHGLGDDGLVGYNVIQYARENLGAAQAAETFGSTYFGNNTIIGGVLKHPGNLSEDAQKRLATSINEKYQGAENAHKIMVLEEAMDFTQTTIPPEQSQFLETRQFSVPEICRWFRMPPHKVHDLTRATFSNIEHEDLEYVKDCLTAWFKRWETEVWSQLLTEIEQRDGIFVEHTVEGLLRGDINSRYGAYQIALGNNNNPGFMTINEVRWTVEMNCSVLKLSRK